MATPGGQSSDDFSERLKQMMAGASPAKSSSPAGAKPLAPPLADEPVGRSIEPVADTVPSPAPAAAPDSPDVAANEPAFAEPPAGRGPVGTGAHVVTDGECISSIAKDAGHFWETIWNDPGNAELRTIREDRNVLLPGDRVYVPPLREKWESGQSETRHRFRRKGQPEVFRMRVLRDGEPRGNQPYTLTIDGQEHKGTTDADGKLSCPIAPNARRARLVVGTAPDTEEYEFTLGTIDPIDEVSGVQGRLNNLGFDCGPVDGKWGPQTEKALKQYQARRRLTVTGRPDEATKQKLREDYGC